MTAGMTRRSMLGCLGVGLAQLLFEKQIQAAGAPLSLTGQPATLNLRLTALTPEILGISIAPFDAVPPTRELGVVKSDHETQLDPHDTSVSPSEPGAGTGFRSRRTRRGSR